VWLLLYIRREQILNAGFDLFIRNGYQGTTTKEIGDAVGIRQGLVFYYFGSTSMSVIGISEGKIAQPLEYIKVIVTSILDSFKTHPLSAKLSMLVAQTQIQVAKDFTASEGCTYDSLISRYRKVVG